MVPHRCVKQKNSQRLTNEEHDLLSLIQTSAFCVPDPLLLQLKELGNIVTSTGQHLYPEFPPLPTHAFENHGGYFGNFADEEDPLLHNLYEEIPCIGVLGAAVMVSLSHQNPGAYNSLVVFNDQQTTANLLGFRPLAFRRNEAKNLAFDNGINLKSSCWYYYLQELRCCVFHNVRIGVSVTSNY